MDNEILLMIAKSGVFAVLFVLLLFYVLKDSRYREQNYQKLVNTLTKELGAVMDIEQDVKEIKNYQCSTYAAASNGVKIRFAVCERNYNFYFRCASYTWHNQ